jgi:hypothetical protein
VRGRLSLENALDDVEIIVDLGSTRRKMAHHTLQQYIAAGSPVQDILAGSADQDIVAGAAVDGIVAATTDQNIIYRTRRARRLRSSSRDAEGRLHHFYQKALWSREAIVGVTPLARTPVSILYNTITCASAMLAKAPIKNMRFNIILTAP